MNKDEVYVGQRVIVPSKFDGKEMGGYTGTVVYIKDGDDQWEVGVEFDECTGYRGHNMNGRITSDRGRWGRARDLDPINDTPEITISFEDIFA